MQEQVNFTELSSDLTFLTNEAGKTLRDRLGVPKIERGVKDVEKGRVYTQEEVEKRMAKWLGK